MCDMQKLQDSVAEWGDKTFGERQNSVGILAHLMKETKELYDAVCALEFGHPDSILNRVVFQKKIDMEFADVTMLLLEAAAKHNISIEGLVQRTRMKLAVNKIRKWGTPSEDGSIQHIEE